jgi:YesN/AraC family two-component response regulator
MYSFVIVDDETELLEGLAHYFPWESIGFSVSGSFSDVRSALAFCKDHHADVLLTDIRMPFMSGLQLIKELKQFPSPPQFCIMSAYDDFGYAKEAIGYGVLEYLLTHKMEVAKQMLTSKVGYKNKEIAEALGYQDTQNFCRTFRKYWGTDVPSTLVQYSYQGLLDYQWKLFTEEERKLVFHDTAERIYFPK